MSLMPNGPPTPLDKLKDELPPPSELAELAKYYFESLDIWVPAIERSSWPDVALRAYDHLDAQLCQPEDVHRLAAVFSVAAHGLLRRADVHRLHPGAQPHQNRQITRAHRWFHLALAALTQPDQGAVLTKPSIWGIRAMTLLSNVELWYVFLSAFRIPPLPHLKGRFLARMI